ncbi:hypothetical protein KHA80_23110 [Anaerobacillus sp. HL2]|nr:hypothetical protein KHA80_23110 [Anaerobacillus sp. HL2]
MEETILKRTQDENYELIKDIVKTSVEWGKELEGIFVTYETDPGNSVTISR